MSHRLRSATMGSLATALVLVLAGCSDAPAALTSPSPELNISSRAPGIYVSSLPVKDTLIPGEQLQLIGVGLDKRGRLITNASLTWTSGDGTRATVSASGRVTAMSVGGPVVITASNGTLTGAKTMFIKTASTPAPGPTPPDPVPPTPTPVPPTPTPVPPTPVPPTPVPPTPSDPSTQTWTFCTTSGQTCVFTGRRDVRLIGAAGGASTTASAFGEIPCAPYAFNNVNPAPGQTLRCDYGDLKTVSMTNPTAGMGGLPATFEAPMGHPGFNGPQIQTDIYNTPSNVDGLGAFRTTCELNNFQFNDPIVYPGRAGASHLHVFFGNTGVNENTTPQSLASTGGSTCRGGTLNRSAYWSPALIDTRTGTIVTPMYGIFYYKSGSNVDVTKTVSMPVGLRMIAGDKSATGPQNHIYWACGGYNGTGMIPDCVNGVTVMSLALEFPQCWDGVNLDSPDHKSHMAYVIYQNPPAKSYCPSTHPVQLPAVSQTYSYPVPPGTNVAYWRLSSDSYSTSIRGGLSAHADWMNGWDPTTMNTIVTRCLNRGLDCGIGNIGNGQTLF